MTLQTQYVQGRTVDVRSVCVRQMQRTMYVTARGRIIMQLFTIYMHVTRHVSADVVNDVAFQFGASCGCRDSRQLNSFSLCSAKQPPALRSDKAVAPRPRCGGAGQGLARDTLTVTLGVTLPLGHWRHWGVQRPRTRAATWRPAAVQRSRAAALRHCRETSPTKHIPGAPRHTQRSSPPVLPALAHASRNLAVAS